MRVISMKSLMLTVLFLAAAEVASASSPDVPYLAPRFDEKGHLLETVESHCTKFTLLDEMQYGGGVQLSAGWYVVSNLQGSVTFGGGVTVNGDVHLIVCDGVVMESDQSAGTLPGIDVTGKSSLTIYAQSPLTNVMGRVVARGGANHAGIEGGSSSRITINGGLIEAFGGSSAAGIGGGQGQDGENITINGGFIMAVGGQFGADVGGGESGDARNIAVNGGTVLGSSRTNRGQRIGCGVGGNTNDVVLAGGCISAGACPTPTDGNGNRVYSVRLPDSASKQHARDMFAGACTVTFKNGYPYCARDVYPIDSGHLFLYLPDGDYEVSVLDESQAVKRYAISVDGTQSKVERIYDYVTFESADAFTLSTANSDVNWDDCLFWSGDLLEWNLWKGESIGAVYSSALSRFRLHVRGSANAYLSRDESERWVLTQLQTGETIACSGNLESLRGGAEENPAVVPMAPYGFSCLFHGCESLSTAPLLPATNLTVGCYAAMFMNCKSLAEPAVLPALDLPEGCYENMFRGCSNILLNEYRKGKIWMIPEGAEGGSNWNRNMLADTGYSFVGDPVIGRKYYLSQLTLVNPADPPRYGDVDGATNGVATSFVIWPNGYVRAAQPNPYAYNRYFWVTNQYDETKSEYVLDVRMTEAISNAVHASMVASLPELVSHITNQVPYTTVYAVPGIYYGIAGTTNLMDIAPVPNSLANVWTVGLDSHTGTQVRARHPCWPSDRAFYRMKATIVPTANE